MLMSKHFFLCQKNQIRRQILHFTHFSLSLQIKRTRARECAHTYTHKETLGRMKTTTATRNNASATSAASSIQTSRTFMQRLGMLAMLLVTFALGARAADYVFTYTNGNNTYFLGQSTTPTTSFVPNTSIYTGNSGSTFRNANGYYIQYNYNSGLTFSATTGTNFTINNNQLAYDFYNGNYIYLYFNNSNSTWQISYSNNRRATAYTVTTSSVINDFTISGEATIKAVGTHSYTHTNATYYDTYKFNNKTYYSTNADQAATTTEPVNNLPTIDEGYTWTISSNNYATVNASTGAITVNSLPATATEVTLTCSVSRNGVTKTATKKITLQQSGNTPTSISASDFSLAVGTDDDISYTLTGTAPIYDKVEATSGNTGIFTVVTSPTSGGKVTLHPVAMGNATLTLIAKAKDGTANACSTTVNITVAERVKTPMIEYTSNGAKALTTITCATEDATIYYTIDGSEPNNTTSHLYENPFEVDEKVTVKAMAVKTGYINSIVASRTYETSRPTGIGGGVVTLNDLEDHNWTYYSGVNASVDGGNYNNNYAGKLYSPNPRNVKITYNGVNGISGSSTNVRVSISENENSFVYYKTLEQGSTQGEYPYTVISNPFSVRPSTGTGNGKVYYGFAGWKIKTGGEYIKTYNNGDVLPLDAEIVFESLPYPSKNCTSAEIVFETTWTQANVQTGNDISTMLSRFSGGTYETNFAVLTDQYTTAWTGNKNATITSVYPDGSSDVRSSSVYTRLNLTLNSGYTIKYEHIHINNSSSTFSMGTGTKTLYLGRGIANSTAGEVCCNLIQGYDGSINSGGLTYTLKIESGIYNYLSFIKGYDGSQTGNTVTGTVAVKGVLGCDYDRAANNNSNLKIQQHAIMGYASTNAVLLKSPAAGAEVLNVTFKSGSLNSSTTSAGTADVAQSFYIGIGGGYSPGYRIFTMEGGEMWSLAAGICQNTAETNSIRFRIKGGLIKGSIYGSAANANSYGYKQMILTGGHVKGWIAGGGNGTSSNGGVTTGSTYIYVGGNCRVDSEGSNTKINSSLGGQVFGSGSGIENTTNWGQLLYGSNVVVADNAYVERDVFGGGNFGWTEQNATIYITGTKASVRSVYGGANQNEGEHVRIYMTGGTVREGLYGGSNMSGDISGDVAMQINGGQVGTPSLPANIHGGGYGQSTIVTGNVNLTLGTSDQTSEGVTVWGDVYGGSALGKVNCTVNNNNYQYTNNTETNVTLCKGTINGSLYGGALGGSNVGTHVYGPVKVKVYGGSVKKTSADGSGGVYGANNKDGAPQRSVTVDIYGTDPAPAENQYALHAVYGGGNQAPYTYGNGYPKVTVHNCDNSIEYVYGGGNAAAVAATDVTIWGGDVIGSVFGGGNGTVKAANVNGNASTKIHGGTILNVYGGSNSQGSIDGTIDVEVIAQGENGNTPCTMNIGNIYGGGNQADSQVGNISIGCTGNEGYIENVFGGANQADITGNIDLHINGGNIGNVFGGNNNSGNISGTVTVTIGDAPKDCGIFEIGNVYGGGNLAPYTAPNNSKNYPTVNMKSGLVRYALYGGGYGKTAIVTGNPQVKMTGGTIGFTETVNGKTIVRGGDIFGGGNAAAVTGNTSVNITGGEVKHNVYGGGNQAAVSGTTNVAIGQ